MWTALDHAFDEAMASSLRYWKAPSTETAADVLSATHAVLVLLRPSDPSYSIWSNLARRYEGAYQRQARQEARAAVELVELFS